MASPGSFRRIGMTAGGHTYNQIVNIGVQLLLVPVLMHAWGIERYGVWLFLSSIPAYLTLSDLGFTFIAKNEMTMKAAGGDQHGALVTYQSVFMLLNLVVIGVAVLAAAGIFAIPLRAIVTLGDVTETDAKGVLAFFTAEVILLQYYMLLSAAMRAAGRPGAEVGWGATNRLTEGVAVAAVALLGGGILAAAMAILINRIIFTGSIFLWVRSIAPWLPLSWTFCLGSEVKRLFNPSISYMFVSIASALMIQGPVTILGLVAEPDRIVVFSTSRTLARLGTSAMNILNYSSMPEYSRLFGLKDTSGFLHILKIHLVLAAACVLIYILVTLYAGDFLLTHWTNGKLRVEEPFFTVLVFSVAAEMIWTVLFGPLASINRHIRVSYSFAVLSLTGIAACYAGAASHGLTGAVMALLGVHLLMIGITAEQLIKRGPGAFDKA